MDAALGATGTVSDAYERIMAAVGEPGGDNALSTLATALETTLMSVTASPQSMTKLTDAVTAAKNLADAVNRVADENVRLRTEADAEIARQVGQVNDALHAIDDINKKIATLAPKGVDVTGLQDERGRHDRRHLVDHPGQGGEARRRPGGALCPERRACCSTGGSTS